METEAVQSYVDPELLLSFLDESEESIATLDASFIDLEKRPGDKELIGGIFRVAHSAKGTAGFLGLAEIKELLRQQGSMATLRSDHKTLATPPIENTLDYPPTSSSESVLFKMKGGQ